MPSVPAPSPAALPPVPDAAVGGGAEVLGVEVEIASGARLDVSGDRGGGTLLVGGDLQGRNPDVMNALHTRIATGALLAADARVFGDGGRIIVWANGSTRFAGHMSARGGEQGGNGGFGETSGRHVLFFQGTADLGARRGRRGTLLLDPTHLTVGGTADINGDGNNGDDYACACELDDAAADHPGVHSRITARALLAVLDTTDVTLAATDTLTIAAALAKTGTAATTLTLRANTITIAAPISSSGGALNLALEATGTTTFTGNSSYRGGTLTSTGLVHFVGTTLDGVTFGGNITTTGGGHAYVRNGLRLAAGSVFDLGSTSLYMIGSQSISVAGGSGAASVRSAGGLVYVNYGNNSDTLTLAEGITWRGWGSFHNYYAGGRLHNHGTLEANGAAGTTLLVQTSDFQSNDPSLIVNNGAGTLRIAPSNRWINNGAIVVNGGTVELVSGDQLNGSGSLALNAGTLILDGALTVEELLGRNYTRNAGTSVQLRGTFDLDGGTLDIGSGGLFKTGGLSALSGATLRNGTLVSGDGTALRGSGTLDGITLGSDLSSAASYLIVRNDLVLGAGTTFNTGNTTLYMQGSQAIRVAGTGTARLVAGGSTVYVNYGGDGQTLTLGSGLDFSGHGGFYNYYADGGLVNQGNLAATTTNQTLQVHTSRLRNEGPARSAGGLLFLAPGSFVNTGALVNDGGTLTLSALDTLTNTGTITLNAGLTRFGGRFTRAALASGYTRVAGSEVNLTGTLDLEGGTLDIGSSGLFGAGGLTAFEGGTVLAGTLVSGDGTQLRGTGTLDGITLGSDLASAASYFIVRNGLRIAAGRTFTTGNTTFYMQGTQSIDAAGPGTASVVAGGSTFYVNYGGAGQTLTLGSGLAFSGHAGFYNYYNDGGLVNQGRFAATTNAQALHVQASRFRNEGLAHSAGGHLSLAPGSFFNAGALANDGGTLTIAALDTLANTGTIALNAGSTRFGGTFTRAALASGYTRLAGSQVHLTGTLDLEGGTLDIGSAGLFGVGGLTSLEGGTLLHGTVASGDGTARAGYGTLDTVTFGSALASTASHFYVRNGLLLADGSTFTLGNTALYFQGSQAMGVAGGGTATVAAAGSTIYVNYGGSGHTLTLGPGVTFRGYAGFYNYYADGGLVNAGRLEATTAGQTLQAHANRFRNEGVARSAGGQLWLNSGSSVNAGALANDGGTLTITALETLANTGTIALNAGRTILGGTFTRSAFATGYSRQAGSELRISGILDLEGGTLDIGGAGLFGAGGLTALEGGTLRNGTLASGDGTPLAGYGVLDGLAIAGNLATGGSNYF